MNDTTNNMTYSQFFMHNMYGLMQGQNVNRYMSEKTSSYRLKDDWPFIMSDSTFAQSGQDMFHKLDNNKKSWDYLRYSIAGLFDFNLFGMPFTGADVCGYEGK